MQQEDAWVNRIKELNEYEDYDEEEEEDEESTAQTRKATNRDGHRSAQGFTCDGILVARGSVLCLLP